MFLILPRPCAGRERLHVEIINYLVESSGHSAHVAARSAREAETIYRNRYIVDRGDTLRVLVRSDDAGPWSNVHLHVVLTSTV